MQYGKTLASTSARDDPGCHTADAEVAVNFQPSGYRFLVRSGETVLEAAQRLGYKMTHACANGVCRICEATMLEGSLRAGFNPYLAQRSQGNHKQEQHGKNRSVLLCKAQPGSECNFEFNRIRGPNELETKKYGLQIVSVEPLSETIVAVNLLAPAGSMPEYFAGQYLQLLVPGQPAAYYSIANAPGSRHIQLHIDVHPENTNAIEVLGYLQCNAVVNAMLPFGKCFLATVPDSEILLISAGTGFSQSKSIAEFLRSQRFAGAVTLYWAERNEQEMYALQLVENWCKENAKWQFVPVYADDPDNEWTGHHDRLVKAVLAGEHRWEKALAYVSGSPAMVYTAMDALLPVGLASANYFSDVLEYAPRG